MRMPSDLLGTQAPFKPMPTYSDIVKKRIARPKPVQIPSLKSLNLWENAYPDWGDTCSNSPQAALPPAQPPAQPTTPTPPPHFLSTDTMQMKIMRDKWACEVSRIPYKILEYNAELRDKMNGRNFNKWCDLDRSFNYYAHCEKVCLSENIGKWVIYENGDSIALFESCIEAQQFMDNYAQRVREFPFPLHPFLLRSTFESATLEEYESAVGDKAFEMRIMDEIERNRTVVSEVVPEETKVVPEETKVVPEETKVVPEETKVVPEVSEKTEVVPEDHEETEVVPAETEVVPEMSEETEVLPKETEAVRMRRPRKHSKIVIHVSHQTPPEIVEQQMRVVNEMRETVEKLEQHITMFEALCEWLGCPRRRKNT